MRDGAIINQGWSKKQPRLWRALGGVLGFQHQPKPVEFSPKTGIRALQEMRGDWQRIPELNSTQNSAKSPSAGTLLGSTFKFLRESIEVAKSGWGLDQLPKKSVRGKLSHRFRADF